MSNFRDMYSIAKSIDDEDEQNGKHFGIIPEYLC